MYIYTDDKEQLLEYASELGDRTSALELIGKHQDYVRQRLTNKDKPKEQNKDDIFKQRNYTRDYEPWI